DAGERVLLGSSRTRRGGQGDTCRGAPPAAAARRGGTPGDLSPPGGGGPPRRKADRRLMGAGTCPVDRPRPRISLISVAPWCVGWHRAALQRPLDSGGGLGGGQPRKSMDPS